MAETTGRPEPGAVGTFTVIGGLLLVLLGLAGAMQAPVWAVPGGTVLIVLLCGGVPFARGRISGPMAWALVLALAATAYALGYGAGIFLIG